MTKDEAVQKLSKVARISVACAEDLYDSFFEKPVVLECVAEWYEEIKENFGYDLVEAINSIPVPIDGVELSDFEKWILDNDDALTTLVNMHQFGYEVEKEKRYTVKLKNKTAKEDYLVKTNNNGFRFFSNIYTDARAHTRKELEDADFGWVFDCPGVEVKEVE